jgi:nitrogen fixation NifU-like protein
VQELALPPVKIHCSVLAEDAVKAAIHDYQAKQEAAKTDGAATAGSPVAAGAI